MSIKALGYMRIEATDVAAWREFALKVLGMVEGSALTTHPPRCAVPAHGRDGRPAGHRARRAGPAARSPAGRSPTPPALQALRETLSKAGVDFAEGTREERSERRVEGLIRFTDPAGNVLEAFHGAQYTGRRFVSPYGHKFVTAEQGLGHVVLPPATMTLRHRRSTRTCSASGCGTR